MAAVQPDPGSHVRLWAGRGVMAMADQFFASGSNFVMSIALARWLPLEDYGAYAVAFSVFLLIATVYQGVLLVPFSVLAMTTFKDQKQEYLGALVRIHCVGASGCVVALWIVSTAWGTLDPESRLPDAMKGMAIAIPGVLAYWLARAAWYTALRPGPAAAGAAGYALLMLSGIWILHGNGLLTSATAFLAMSTAGLLTGLALLAALRPTGGLSMSEAWGEGWKLGRWELAVAAAQWLPMNLCFPLSATFLGTAQTAALRALQNLAQPIQHSVTAILRVLQPYVSGRYGEQGAEALRPVVRIAILAMGFTSVYAALAWQFDEPLMGFFYGEKFAAAAHLLPWVLTTAVLAQGIESLALGLRAARDSRGLFHAQLAAGICYVLTGIPGAYYWGLGGVVATLILAAAVGLIAAIVQFQRAARRGPAVQQFPIDVGEAQAKA